MDKFKEKLATLREEVNVATTRADNAELEVKRLQDEQTQKDHETTSLRNKLQL
ncbi:hypothetical protein BG011_010239, partial [Mortierella polycephala]